MYISILINDIISYYKISFCLRNYPNISPNVLNDFANLRPPPLRSVIPGFASFGKCLVIDFMERENCFPTTFIFKRLQL